MVAKTVPHLLMWLGLSHTSQCGQDYPTPLNVARTVPHLSICPGLSHTSSPYSAQSAEYTCGQDNTAAPTAIHPTKPDHPILFSKFLLFPTSSYLARAPPLPPSSPLLLLPPPLVYCESPEHCSTDHTLSPQIGLSSGLFWCVEKCGVKKCGIVTVMYRSAE